MMTRMPPRIDMVERRVVAIDPFYRSLGIADFRTQDFIEPPGIDKFEIH